MLDYYLAAPYSDPDPMIVNQRVQEIDLATAWLIKQRFIIYSPISATHHLTTRFDIPTDAGYWKEFNRRFIKFSYKVAILTLPGWKTSIGVCDEIQMAKSFGKPIFLMHQEDQYYRMQEYHANSH